MKRSFTRRVLGGADGRTVLAHHTQVASPAGCAACHQTAPIPSHRRTDHLECAASSASAAEQLGVSVGDPVELRRS